MISSKIVVLALTAAASLSGVEGKKCTLVKTSTLPGTTASPVSSAASSTTSSATFSAPSATSISLASSSLSIDTTSPTASASTNSESLAISDSSATSATVPATETTTTPPLCNPTANLVRNAGFEDGGISPWIATFGAIFDSSATDLKAQEGSKYFRTGPNPQVRKSTLDQTIQGVQQGIWYRLTFAQGAGQLAEEAGQCQLNLQIGSVDTFPTLGFVNRAVSEWETSTFDFIAAENDPKLQIQVVCGGTRGIDIILDEFSITERCGGGK